MVPLLLRLLLNLLMLELFALTILVIAICCSDSFLFSVRYGCYDHYNTISNKCANMIISTSVVQHYYDDGDGDDVGDDYDDDDYDGRGGDKDA